MSYVFDWQRVLSGRYLEWIIQGVWISLSLMLLSTIFAIVQGALLTLGQLSKHRIIRFTSFIFIELSRGIPTLIWLFLFYFVFPLLFPETIGVRLNAFHSLNYWAAVAGLSISSSGYISEIMRGGIASVPNEHISAAYTSGLSRFNTWRHIIIPQALRICFPPLVSRIIHNLKNSSLALTISVREIVWASRQIESITFRGIEATIIVTVFFLCINYSISRGAMLLEKVLYKNKFL